MRHRKVFLSGGTAFLPSPAERAARPQEKVVMTLTLMRDSIQKRKQRPTLLGIKLIDAKFAT